MRRLPLLVVCLLACLSLLACSAFAQVAVTVSIPAGDSASSPISVQASAKSQYTITGWRIYLDSVDVWSAGQTSSINASISTAAGQHTVVVRAWDSTGAYGDQTVSFVVTANTVNVAVVSPASGATASSPAQFIASAASQHAITGWAVYVDGSTAFVGNSAALNTVVSMASGVHTVVVRAWNETGVYGSETLSVTVPTVSSGVVPSDAFEFADVEDTQNWGKCSDPTCSGGVAFTTDYWFAPYQASPSLDGTSTQFHISGPAYATDLFWNKLGAHNQYSHFQWDFWVRVDSTTGPEALEFDMFQVVSGYKYMFGSQCHYFTGRWDVWNEQNQKWVQSNALCAPFAPDAWHHVIWRLDRLSGQTHYLSITVDGVTQQIIQTVAYEPAVQTSWNDVLGVQVQQDLSSNPGNGINEWVDKMNLWVW